MASQFSALEDSLKFYYKDGYVQDQHLRDRVFFNMLKKTKRAFGRGYVHAIRDRRGGNVSHIASTAIANASKNTGVLNMTLRTNRYHAAVDLDGKDIARAKSPDAAFIKEITDNLDDSVNGVMDKISFNLLGDGTLSLGVITAVSGLTFTVSAFHATRLHKNMRLSFLDTSATVAAKAAVVTTGAGTTITAVDYETGVVTVDVMPTLEGGSSPAAITLAAGDFFGPEGAWVAGSTYSAATPFIPVAIATGSNSVADFTILGLGAWIPETVTSTSFGGLDRTTAPQLTAGWRSGTVTITANGHELEDAIFDMAAKIRVRSVAKPDMLVISLNRYTQLMRKQSNKVVPLDKESAGAVGIGPTEMIRTPGGNLKIVVETDLPDDVCYVLDSSTWEFCYESEDIVELVNDDGYYMSRLGTDDGLQARYRSFTQLLCHAPICNGRIKLAGSVAL